MIIEKTHVTKFIVTKLVDGREVGYATLIIDTKRTGKPAALIEDMLVHDKADRGKGYGRELCEKCIKLARDEGYYKVVLHCADSNRIFYGKCGFKLWQNGMRYDL